MRFRVQGSWGSGFVGSGFRVWGMEYPGFRAPACAARRPGRGRAGGLGSPFPGNRRHCLSIFSGGSRSQGFTAVQRLVAKIGGGLVDLALHPLEIDVTPSAEGQEERIDQSYTTCS